MRPDGEEWGGLRGSATYTALPCSEPPSNLPALGLGFDAWGHSRETRELAGAVGEVATPCTDVGRQKTRLRGSGYTNPRYPTRPKDIHLENLEK